MWRCTKSDMIVWFGPTHRRHVTVVVREDLHELVVWQSHEIWHPNVHGLQMTRETIEAIEATELLKIACRRTPRHRPREDPL